MYLSGLMYNKHESHTEKRELCYFPPAVYRQVHTTIICHLSCHNLGHAAPKISSLSTLYSHADGKVGWNLVLHKTFLEPHSKTVLQHSPKQQNQRGTSFKTQGKKQSLNVCMLLVGHNPSSLICICQQINNTVKKWRRNVLHHSVTLSLFILLFECRDPVPDAPP